MQRIEADMLIPGRGDPVKNGCVVIDGGKIAYAGPVEKAPEGGETIGVPAVMPGMWDCHGHFLGAVTGNLEELAKTPVQVLAARAADDASKALIAGFTSIREPGGLGVYLARVVNEGTLPGPHIYGAGAALSQTGGHGDFHSLPLDFVHALSASLGLSYLCDGIAECRKGVRTQLRIGAKLIKVLASGGVMSELDHPMHAQFSDEELRAIVEEAGRAERIVAAHCHGKAGIVAALKAGCSTIEHGSFLDEEAVEMMVERKAILVPTRFVLERVMKLGQETGIPEYAYEKLRALIDHHREALRLAVKKGVRIALGTDIFNSGGRGPVPWGLNGHEAVKLVEAGMTPLQAIEAATANGPPTLGPQAPKSGQLREGYDADVIAIEKNPLRGIDVLASPDKISHVWKSGRLSKGLAH